MHRSCERSRHALSGAMTTGGDLDWRLTVEFESPENAHGIFSALMTRTAAVLAADKAKEGIIVQHDTCWLRMYGASYDALRRAQAIVVSALEAEGVRAEEQAEHRDADGTGWTPVELPPLTEREAHLVSEHHGKGPWGSEAEPDRVQAHFELGSRHAAQRFAAELAADGYDVHHAGSFVFIFADDGAKARELGSALKARAPADAQLFFEGEGRTFFI
jgi:hypothetical protein